MQINLGFNGEITTIIPTVPKQTLTPAQQSVQDTALPIVHSASTSSFVNSGKVSISSKLRTLCNEPFLIEYDNLKIDPAKHNKLKKYLETVPPSLIEFMKLSECFSEQDLDYLKYLVLESLEKNDERGFSCYVSLMNKINPASPITLSATAYASVWRAYNDRDQIPEARTLLHEALAACPNARDLKLLSFTLLKITSPAKAVIAALNLEAEGILLSVTSKEIDKLVQHNLHNRDFIKELNELLNNAAALTKNPGIVNTSSILTTTLTLTLQYHDGKYTDILSSMSEKKIRKNPSHLGGFASAIAILSFIKMNRVAEAEKMLHCSKESPNKHLLISYLLYSKGEFEKGETELLQALDPSKEECSTFIFCQLCPLIADKTKDFIHPAITMRLESIVKHCPDNAPALRTLLISYTKKWFKDYSVKPLDEIMKKLRGYEQLNPPDLHFVKLQVYQLALSNSISFSKTFADEIYSDYKRINIIDNDFVAEFGQALEKDNRDELALKLYNENFDLTKDGRILVPLYFLLIKLGKIKEADAIVQDFAKTNPKSIYGIFLQARQMYLMRNKLDEALDLATKGGALDPSFEAIKFLRAQILFAKREYALAAKQVERIKNPQEKSYVCFLPNLFKCYAETYQFEAAERVLRGKHAQLISQQQRTLLQIKMKQQAENKLMAKFDINAVKPDETPTETSSGDDVEEACPVPTRPIEEKQSQLNEKVTATSIVIKPKAAPSQPHHYQPFSKDAVGSLNPKARVEQWLQNPKLLKDACTIDLDPELYPRSKPAAAAAVQIATTEVIIPGILTAYEKTCLENAIKHLNEITTWIREEHLLVTTNPQDAIHYFHPRKLVYHVLKFGEALTPTGVKQKLISLEFENAIQTHVLSTTLTQYLRELARHRFNAIDMVKLKTFCSELIKTSVLYNLTAFLNGEVIKQKKVSKVAFTNRTSLCKDQNLTHDGPLDYRQCALFELNEIKRLTAKLDVNAINSDSYRDGLKMAICTLEECFKRLQIVHPALKRVFDIGNIVGHNMVYNPKDYANEDISITRVLDIIKEIDRIIEIVNPT